MCLVIDGMQILRLNETHLPAVVALEKACFSEPWSENALRLLISENAVGAVCVEQDEVLAYGGMLWAPDEGQITNIAVSPDARRRGCGRAVLNFLIGAARERGCEMISLEVRESNAAAVALYEHAGFVVAGRRKRFYRSPAEDALVMLLQLPKA